MLGIHAKNEIVDLIGQRADALGWSKSKYAEAILELWIAEGCPAVNDYERVALQISPGKKTA